MKTDSTTVAELQLKYQTGKLLGNQIKTSLDAFQCISPLFDKDTIELQEHFYALFLNRSNRTIGSLFISKGGISGTVVDIRILLATGLKALASGVILSHNHPSGNLKPSESDIDLTGRIRDALRTMDMSLVDHLILSPSGEFYSMADNGDL